MSRVRRLNLEVAMAFWLSLALMVAPVAAAPAEQGGAPSSEQPASGNGEEVAPDSPRAALRDFLELARRAAYEDAGKYLMLPSGEIQSGARLAEHLKSVLDHYLWVDLESISAGSAGDRSDGLAGNLEQIGQVPGPSGALEPVRLLRRPGQEPAWVFAPATVARIEAWYAPLPNRWLVEQIPRPLRRMGPGDLAWWQWLALPLVILAVWFTGSLFSRISRSLLKRVAKRTEATWDEEVLERLAGPLTLGWMLVVFFFLLPWIDLNRSALGVAKKGVSAGFLIALFWALARLVDVVQHAIASTPWAKEHSSSRSLLPLGSRVAKVLVFALAVVALLSELGYPVASLIAGLGIGGVAVALAAQKTVENLFGAFSIGADEPFREGDFVKIEDFVGTVEAIGLRSTRIRTLDRTLISIPNGRLADMRLESFTARDRLRLACTIGLVYETSEAQMREVLAGFERVLREHPKIWPDTVVVRFKEFGASSLDIEIMAWFLTTDWGEFQVIRQEILLGFMGVVEAAGSSFAFPTRTVHLVGGSPEPVSRG